MRHRRIVLMILVLTGIALHIAVAETRNTTRKLTFSAVKNKYSVKANAAASKLVTGPYVVLAWNDLGMHCISPRFAEIAILPPYNTIQAVVIRRGVEPEIVTQGVTVKYAMDNPDGMVDSTDFWQNAQALFGVNLPPGVGLTGNGYSGTMTYSSTTKLHSATGIPALPFNRINGVLAWQPYQTATVSAYQGTTLIGQTKIVVPVSDEMNCQKCHTQGGAADPKLKLKTMTTESYILALHDMREGTQLVAKRPVLCASCHADAALGTPGQAGVKSLSLAMHAKHSVIAQQPNCYDCHPGANTQCNRSAINGMGPVGTDPGCTGCHGNLNKMTLDLKNGRKPWQQEPTCAQCHGSRYSTGTKLYREGDSHHNVPCIACHNSPHAWSPTSNALDGIQPNSVQGNNRAIGYNGCSTCHTDGRTGTMPPHEN